ncbi:MAG TPA: hypothetical protein VGM87_04890 [Roseomonas sp.]|jgi:hypothetical protein
MTMAGVEKWHPVFGTLTRDQSEDEVWWDGHVALPGLARRCAVMVMDAGTEGPTAAQAAAMRRILDSAAEIRRLATAPLIASHQAIGLLPLAAAADPDRIWDVLDPEWIEVADPRQGNDGRIAVALMFGSTQHAIFAWAIETLDGVFDRVELYDAPDEPEDAL